MKKAQGVMKKAQGVTWKRAGGPPCENDLAGTLWYIQFFLTKPNSSFFFASCPVNNKVIILTFSKKICKINKIVQKMLFLSQKKIQQIYIHLYLQTTNTNIIL